MPDKEVPTNNPDGETRTLTPVDNQPETTPQGEPQKPADQPVREYDPVKDSEVILDSGNENIEVLDGHRDSITDDMSKIDRSRRTGVKPEGEKEIEQPTPPESTEQKDIWKDQEFAEPVKGKFKTVRQMEESYGELERKLTQQGQDKAVSRQKLTKTNQVLNEQNVKLERQIQNLNNQSGKENLQNLTDEELNGLIAENPAAAMRYELDRRDTVQTQKDVDRRHKDRITSLKAAVEDTKETMVEEYDTFADDAADFGDWMNHFGMNTNRVLSNKKYCEQAYRAYLDNTRDLSEVASESHGRGQAEALEKISQVPAAPSTGTKPPPGSNAQPQLTPIGEPITPAVQSGEETEPQPADALAEMEHRMGIGGRPEGMW